jgi:PhoH-like ATPase
VPLRSDLDAWGLMPRNNEQKMALDLLLNDDIKLVTLVGKAGTGLVDPLVKTIIL